MLERIEGGRRIALAVAAAFSALLMTGCGGETSSGGVQAQPGVYPVLLIGLFLVIGGAVATWVVYRGGSKSVKKSNSDRGGVVDARNNKLSDEVQADPRQGADGAVDGRNE